MEKVEIIEMYKNGNHIGFAAIIHRPLKEPCMLVEKGEPLIYESRFQAKLNAKIWLQRNK